MGNQNPYTEEEQSTQCPPPPPPPPKVQYDKHQSTNIT